MNPIQFIFGLLSNHLQISEAEYDFAVQQAQSSWETSSIKAKIEKWWWLPLLLGVIYTVAKPRFDALLDSWVGDQDDDGDIDIADTLLLLAQKLKGNGQPKQ